MTNPLQIDGLFYYFIYSSNMTKKRPSLQPRVEEGFPHQRLVILPPNAIERCKKSELIKQIYVTHIGAYPSAPNHYVERQEGATQAILIYCMKGIGWLQLDNITFKVNPGCAVIIPPNVSHIYRADKDDPWSLFWIHFDGKQVSALLKNLEIDLLKPLLYIANPQAMRQAFEDVYACLNYNHSESGLFAMSAEFMRLLSRIKLEHSAINLKHKLKEDGISSSIRFMQKHLDMSIPLADLAAQAGQSVAHYSKLFRQRTNQSPSAYFIQMKVRKACDQLYQTNLSVREIAEQLGYSDPYYFSRIFKKVQGVSPAQYRTIAKSG
ncbi:AraC family transcriptional regulator [Neiella sp. HB171785]|uniref:AraC family transcriptional regulator n=1 Tax=Neiella litorisoli TaxID=2771431 RepID=A0A8J6QJP7_9GAMM|nr:AraC family transcriptional regulator [Neiella litorisoli]MBD1390413.1 AraC family transcriptional regulator [Neiella litorisoli]